MNERKFTRKLFLLIVFLFVLNGCSNYKDQQAIPPETLPEAIIKVMSNAYPDATDATFLAIEKDKLYEVYYNLKGNSFYAALNTKKILSVYRMHGALPDSMRQSLPARSVSGGVADTYKEPDPQINDEKIFDSKYNWGSRNYLLTWVQNKASKPAKYQVRLEPYFKFSYIIGKDDLNALPTPAGSFLEREKLRFATARISVNEKNEKEYEINAYTASSTNYDFTFDASGKLINTSYRAEAFYYNIDEYPEKIQNFVKGSTAFATMKILEGYKFSDPTGTGYGMSLQGTGEDARLIFDQDGNFVKMIYQTTIDR
ncbi:hypothetical protein SAMN04487996_101342 [Dyadobacter soli]|uniref:Putative beta-lactamase-inhibitor-like PepSY-like domain-containing protein n=1 Tax=Dyadobacter soli TaxID=659014 RepID=A0A1G6VTS8_9BACT|nr:PepSY-like domain-containing protein [Dyadobacter soli]SDD57090.1 hypothetical protein SAMN04487996_101342 [Dyadobacter soli]